MKLEKSWITVATPAGPLPAYAARPAAAKDPLPGVLVLQEAWGVDEHICDVTERFAVAGYQAIAPDLFARGGQRPAALAAPRLEQVKNLLDQLPPASMAQLFDPGKREALLAEHVKDAAKRAEITGTIGALFPIPPMESYLDLLLATATHLRQGPSKGRKIGAVGYCMGGGLAAILATGDPDLAAAVIYYGMAPPAERIPAIRCPVLGLYGKNDPRLIDALPAFEAAMREAGKQLEVVVYETAGHAFSNDTRKSFHMDATRDAFARTLALFARQLV